MSARAVIRTVAGAALVAGAVVLARLPLLAVPLDPDEGGYAYLARRWAAGARLYDDAWVDRPQGLMIAYRLVTSLSYTPLAIRVAAVIAGVVLSLSVAGAAWVFAGRRGALAAGLLSAVVGAGAFVQGYEFNGELIAAALGAPGVALALWWWRQDRAAVAWLIPGGVLCGAAVTVKQSALDAAIVLISVSLARRGRRRAALAASGLGLAIPLGAALAHAAFTGWSRWWFAVVYFQGSLAGRDAPWVVLGRAIDTAMAAGPDLLGLTVVAAIGAVAAWRAHSQVWPALVWVAAAVAFAGAGPFVHPHYWVQVVGPLALLAGIAVAGCSWRRCAVLVVIAVLVPLATQVFLAPASPARRTALVFRNNHSRRVDPELATWVRRHTAPADGVYAFVAAADIYLLAGRDSGYPYLWLAPVTSVPGALTRLRSWLDGSTGPRWIIMYQAPDSVDPSGALGQILSRRYRPAERVDGYVILRRCGLAAAVGSCDGL